MWIKSFLGLVEIRTKVASVIPLLLGTLIAIYSYKEFNYINFVLMCISLISIDMATTAINNFMDFKRAIKKQGYGYEIHNTIVKDNLSENKVKVVIVALLLVAISTGVLLFLNTNIVVLILGVISFGVAIGYSFGPIPISRTPFGELFSGVFMGGIITFLAVYVHIFHINILNVYISRYQMVVGMNIKEIIKLFLLVVPVIGFIGNIMLANNICDREDDIENRRYTLPVYVGNEISLRIFKWTYYVGYLVLVVDMIFGIEPITSVVALLTFFMINKNIKSFEKEHIKSKTFVLSVKNFIAFNGIRVLGYFAIIIYKFASKSLI